MSIEGLIKIDEAEEVPDGRQHTLSDMVSKKHVRWHDLRLVPRECVNSIPGELVTLEHNDVNAFPG
jgi:hypothetical protein